MAFLILVENGGCWGLIGVVQYSVKVAEPLFKSAMSRSSQLEVLKTYRVPLVFYFRDSRWYLADKTTDVVAQVFNVIDGMDSFTKTAIWGPLFFGTNWAYIQAIAQK